MRDPRKSAVFKRMSLDLKDRFAISMEKSKVVRVAENLQLTSPSLSNLLLTPENPNQSLLCTLDPIVGLIPTFLNNLTKIRRVKKLLGGLMLKLTN